MDAVNAVAQQLAVWRAAGADQQDPLRFAYLEALARRTAGHGGSARQLLDARLAAAVQAFGQALADGNAAASAAARRAARSHGLAHRAALTGLADGLHRAPAAGATPGTSAAAPGGSTALKVVQQHGATWARLRVDQRLNQAQAAAPENAGPLNSHALVLRALADLRTLSPAYLAHFMAYVDALAWLDHAADAAAPAVRPAPRSRAGARVRPKPG